MEYPALRRATSTALARWILSSSPFATWSHVVPCPELGWSMKAVLMALVMTIRLSSGIRVRLLLCAQAYHTSRNGATDPSRANKFKLREFPKRGNSFRPCVEQAADRGQSGSGHEA